MFPNPVFAILRISGISNYQCLIKAPKLYKFVHDSILLGNVDVHLTILKYVRYFISN